MDDATARSGGTILIVDDNATHLAILLDMLQGAGYRVLVAQGGEAALEMLNDERPDLFLIDILMPGIDGFETVQRLKAAEQCRDIPVIFMTALSETIDKMRGFSLGAVDYITKPFRHEEVLARVHTHITIRRLQMHLMEKNRELSEVNHNLEGLVADKTRQLVQQEKAAVIGRMIQGIVHNLKTPLAVIRSSAETIRRRVERLRDGEDGDLAETLEGLLGDAGTALRAHEHLLNIVDTLMHKSRMDQRSERMPVHLNELLQQEMEFFNADSRFKHVVQKDFAYDPDLPVLDLVYGHIAQVIENLIRNALDAMWRQEAPRLGIATRMDDGQVYIDIRDNGTGMAPETIGKIFDPFLPPSPSKARRATANRPERALDCTPAWSY